MTKDTEDDISTSEASDSDEDLFIKKKKRRRMNNIPETDDEEEEPLFIGKNLTTEPLTVKHVSRVMLK